jgi:hypothetical protein
MRAKHARFAAATAVGVSLALFGGAAFAAICPDVSVGSTAPCAANDQPIDVVIDNFPVTKIVNWVDNSLILQEVHGRNGQTLVNIIKSAPTTTIYNLVENSINVQIDGPRGTSINASIDSEPSTTILNEVDNSVSFSDLTGVADSGTITSIESSPTTKIYNEVDNSVNIGSTGIGDGLPSSQFRVVSALTSQTITIDNEPATELSNLVDNSVTLDETISTLSGTLTTVVNNVPTTVLINLVYNTIDLHLSDPLGIPIDLFIDSMPITLVENLVDNSVSATVVPEPSSLSLVALGLCAFGLLRRGTTKSARAPRTPFYVGQYGGQT